MVRPISLRLRQRQDALIAKALATLGSARETRLKQSHDAAVMRRAREIVAQAREQDRLRRCAKLAALKALAASRTAFGSMRASTSSDVDQQHWHERQEIVERELQEILTRASR